MIPIYKVVIADDEPSVVNGLSKQVDWDSFNMELAGTANSGYDALRIIAGGSISLLITDVRMPQMDGLTLIEKAKRINPSLRCIVISAHENFEYVRKALLLGVENYLLKPISQDELNDTLARTLSNLGHDQIQTAPQVSDLQIFRNNILNRWVNGTIQDYELNERAGLLQINLSEPDYAVCVIGIVPEMSVEQKLKYATQILDLCNKTVLTIFDGECFADDSIRIVLIIHGKNLTQTPDKLGGLLEDICNIASEQGVPVFASIGPYVYNCYEIYTSYECAVLHLNYHLLNPSVNLVSCKKNTDKKKILLQQQFEKAAEDLNLDQALVLCKYYLEPYEIYENNDIREDALYLALILIRVFTKSGHTKGTIPESLLAQFSAFYSLSSGKSIADWLQDTVIKAFHTVKSNKKALHPLLYRSIEAINQNYADELSLKTLAARFFVSPAYLGQLFKEETGQFFNDYITHVRIQAAVRLLLDTNMKIYEIIKQVGIPNQSYFNRVFKKKIGISPMDFRRAYNNPDP